MKLVKKQLTYISESEKDITTYVEKEIINGWLLEEINTSPVNVDCFMKRKITISYSKQDFIN